MNRILAAAVFGSEPVQPCCILLRIFFDVTTKYCQEANRSRRGYEGFLPPALATTVIRAPPSDPNDTWAHDINFLLDEKECAFPRLGEDNVEYFLGLTPSGIIVLRNKTKVGNYYWPRISKIYFKGRYFMLRVCDKNLYVGGWRGWEGNGTQPILPSARVKRGSKSPANLTACWREGSQTGLRDTSRKPEMKGSLYCYCRLRLQFCATWSRLGVPPLSVLPPSPQTPD
uniref:(California timema) hypothetical protein n=1 Tax=Timema californicum TaxID=61474 RepID=A0A7R9P469_TIMCA|nr:unnamed protein product [Timema californicum]